MGTSSFCPNERLPFFAGIHSFSPDAAPMILRIRKERDIFGHASVRIFKYALAHPNFIEGYEL